MRSEYAGEGLSEDGVAPTPLRQVRAWVADAQARQAERGDVVEPTALSVATVDSDGHANVRTVLMRFLDERGPGFVTDLGSAKSREIVATGSVAASLTWPAMYRAVRFRGRAVPVGRDEIAAYFATRPWGSRISAWASDQSQPVADRATLVAAYERYAALYPDTGSPDDVPVPDGWGAGGSRATRSSCGRADATGCTTGSSSPAWPTGISTRPPRGCSTAASPEPGKPVRRGPAAIGA